MNFIMANQTWRRTGQTGTKTLKTDSQNIPQQEWDNISVQNWHECQEQYGNRNKRKHGGKKT